MKCSICGTCIEEVEGKKDEGAHSRQFSNKNIYLCDPDNHNIDGAEGTGHKTDKGKYRTYEVASTSD